MGYLDKKPWLDPPPIDFRPRYIRRDRNVYCGEAIQEKECVLKYLTYFYPNFSSSGKIHDCVLDKDVERSCNLSYFDGVYFWNDADIYHIKKYDMPLDPEFVEYAVKRLSDLCRAR